MIIKRKNIDVVSKLGYSDNSPYRNRPENLIRSNVITMQNTSIPLLGIGLDAQGNEVERKELPAYSGKYLFEKSVHVKEIPMAVLKKKKGGVLCTTPMMQSGGTAPLYVQDKNNSRLRAYSDSTAKYNASVNDKRMVDQKLQQYSKANGMFPVKENIKPAVTSNRVMGQKNDPINMVSYTNRPGQPKFDEVYDQYKKPQQPVVLGMPPAPVLATAPIPPLATRSYSGHLPLQPEFVRTYGGKKMPAGYTEQKPMPVKTAGVKWDLTRMKNNNLAMTYDQGGKLVQLNGETGKVQLHLQGGERIFSRKDTEALVKASKLAKSEKELEALGKMAYGFLKIQDMRKPEYVSQ